MGECGPASYNEDVNHHSRGKRFLLYVLPLLAWMLLIFLMSTDFASSENTKPIVRSLFLQLFPAAADYFSPYQIGLIDYNLRKFAHVTEYAILAVLAYRAVVFGARRFRNAHVIWPFLIGVAYAASDEYHQSFYPSRGAKADDVFIDAAGVTLGLLLCLWRRAATAEKRESPDS